MGFVFSSVLGIKDLVPAQDQMHSSCVKAEVLTTGCQEAPAPRIFYLNALIVELLNCYILEPVQSAIYEAIDIHLHNNIFQTPKNTSPAVKEIDCMEI